jgi:2-polyprenyl-6-methoxyphenol hydroxylase-like FAD-dependent oxidoreductase
MAKIGEHAAVLGASMGGLSAARMLADFYETVTVVERDALPDGAETRRGVPQGRHGHALLGRGLEILEESYPGFAGDLDDAGVPALDYRDLSEAYMSFAGHVLPRDGAFANVPPVYIPSRPLLESLVRQRLRASDSVTLLDGYDVVGLASNAAGDRVTGVRVKAHTGDREHCLSADLVVDATGRGARTPAFLEALGYRRPPEDQVKVRVAYSSQLLHLPPGSLREKIVMVGAIPGRPTGLVLLGYENDMWMFTAFGMAGHEPPHELAQMMAFARDVAPGHVHEALEAGEPLAAVSQFRYPESRWRRFDKLGRFPDGLVAVGDAICSFNPIYGQGMTVAMLQAQALGQCLEAGPNDLARRYFRAAAKPTGVAWQFAAGADLNQPEVAGHRPLTVRLTNKYAERLQTVGETDVDVAEQFMRVVALLDPPSRLMRPKMLMRAALHRQRSPAPQAPMVLARP